jgi:uncharacterized protein (TIGR03435 family)
MKTKLLILALVLMAAAVAAVKIFFSPSVKDAYFAMDERSLRSAPAGMFFVRPTHFPFLKEKGILRARASSSTNNEVWVMGRNAPLRDVIAAGYNWDQARVMLPADAPAGRFDFLMTGTSQQLTQFQKTIRRQFGYVAQKESRDTDVLALKIVNPALPALTINHTDGQGLINFRNQKLYFTHLPPRVLINVFGRFLELPVVDKTGLTNSYDFTIDWNAKADQSFQQGTLTRDKLEQVVGTLGFKLEPDTAPLEVLVVKKAD